MAFDLATSVKDYLATGKVEGLPNALFIDGESVAAESRQAMATWDPATARVFAEFAAGQAEDVDRAVASSQQALKAEWSRVTPSQRGKLLRKVAELIRKNSDRLSFVEALDAGKRLDEAMGDVAGAANCFDYYAGACDKYQGISIPLGPDYVAYTMNEPLGVTAHIIPWNYPLSTAARGIAPALAAGCTVIAKPAEQTPLTALILAELCIEAGLPKGVFNVITGTGQAAGAALVKHPGVHHITFTGSVTTGIDVMRMAASNITHVLLELGGKSPIVALADCDLELTADNVIAGIFENAGQICSAGSRLLVHESIHAALVEKVLKKTKAIHLGHGLRNSGMGPLNSELQLKRVSGHVESAKSRGIQVLSGGNSKTDPHTGLGWFYEPTLLDRVPLLDPAVQQEIFCPVLCIQTFVDIEEAVHLANGTQFGLVAGIFTKDLSAAHRLAQQIDAGQIYVNEYFAGGIAVPFGGNKHSGFGREKGLEAVGSYCKTKSVVARI